MGQSEEDSIKPSRLSEIKLKACMPEAVHCSARAVSKYEAKQWDMSAQGWDMTWHTPGHVCAPAVQPSAVCAAVVVTDYESSSSSVTMMMMMMMMMFYYVVNDSRPHWLPPGELLSQLTSTHPHQRHHHYHIHTLCLKKTRHLIFYHNFGKCELNFKILSQPYS